MTQSRGQLIQQLKPFEGRSDGDWFIARTGYTGEDGLEIILPAEQAPASSTTWWAPGFHPSVLGPGIPCAWKPG
ncbi:hypothetical protein [Pseudomonas sp. FEN]|uniref:hypothetical protein n=1 Tax=Pseudomonas sp. FEN TaxID=2767468 RepID=UPI0021E5181A|nr:hypothetical protein [Pseudomonas sp. FEN]